MFFEYIRVRAIENRVAMWPDMPPQGPPNYLRIIICETTGITQEVIENRGELDRRVVGVDVRGQDHNNLITYARDVGSILEDLVKRDFVLQRLGKVTKRAKERGRTRRRLHGDEREGAGGCPVD